MEGTPRTTSLTFYSGGKDNPRKDRRMEAKLDKLEKDHDKLQENILTLTQRVDFLRNEFKELKSSGNELINNKITVLEERVEKFDRLLMEEHMGDGAKPPKKRRRIPNELSVRSEAVIA